MNEEELGKMEVLGIMGEEKVVEEKEAKDI